VGVDQLSQLHIKANNNKAYLLSSFKTKQKNKIKIICLVGRKKKGCFFSSSFFPHKMCDFLLLWSIPNLETANA